MVLFKDIRKRISLKILKSDVRRNHIQRRTINFNEARTIGVLFTINSMTDIPIVRKFIETLEEKNKKVMNIGYVGVTGFEKNQSHNFPELEFYYSKDLTMLYKPKGRKVFRFIKTEFDILISLNYTNNFSVDYIAAKSKATFRVGPYHKDRTLSYDLMMDVSKKDLNILIDQINHYLSIIKRK